MFFVEPRKFSKEPPVKKRKKTGGECFAPFLKIPLEMSGNVSEMVRVFFASKYDFVSVMRELCFTSPRPGTRLTVYRAL